MARGFLLNKVTVPCTGSTYAICCVDRSKAFKKKGTTKWLAKYDCVCAARAAVLITCYMRRFYDKTIVVPVQWKRWEWEWELWNAKNDHKLVNAEIWRTHAHRLDIYMLSARFPNGEMKEIAKHTRLKNHWRLLRFCRHTQTWRTINMI